MPSLKRIDDGKRELVATGEISEAALDILARLIFNIIVERDIDHYLEEDRTAATAEDAETAGDVHIHVDVRSADPKGIESAVARGFLAAMPFIKRNLR